MNMRVSWDASHGPLGGILGASERLFGASWGPLGGVLGASWGRLGGLLGASWGLLGAQDEARMEPSWAQVAILRHLGSNLDAIFNLS